LQKSEFEYQNILVIDLGQLGDVVLSLPALNAIREKFAPAKITVLVTKPAAGLIEMSQLVNEIISVDRRELRNNPKLRSIRNLFRLAGDVRRRRFDLVIDLHSLYETNILGFLSGAPRRLYANRENRSLDFLSKFPTRPPLEDKSKHQTDRYLAVLKPLGIENSSRLIALVPPEEERNEIFRLLGAPDIGEKKLVGLFLGAGHPSRQWSLDKFVALTERLSQHNDIKVLVFMGPEERAIRAEASEKLSDRATIIKELGLPSFMAALSFLDVLVCGDTGPMHLASVVGPSIVLLAEKAAPATFFPLTDTLKVVRRETVEEIGVDEVFSAVVELAKNHSDKHKQPKENKQHERQEH
jgi:ADP-heptose:LPS heptosyltransferase